MTNDIDIKLIGDNDLANVLRSLDFATQHKTLKAILRDAGNKEIVTHLKRATPVVTGKLRKSMGVVAGRSKRNATIFVGPRMSHGKTRAGVEGYSGWVANILEFAKPGRRTPENAKAFKPFFGGPGGAGFVTSVGPIRKKTHFSFVITSRLRAAEIHITKSTRTVIERTWKRKSKGLAGYAQAKGR